MHYCKKLAFGTALLAASSSGFSATATTTFAVSATVSASCSVSAAALGFGTLGTPIGTNVDAQSNITATCAGGAAYTVALNAGTGTGATLATRKLTSGANTLPYTLYLDASRSQIWGDGTGSTSVSSQTGTGSAQALTVYGRIPAGSSPLAGAYSDTITVTVTY